MKKTIIYSVAVTISYILFALGVKYLSYASNKSALSFASIIEDNKDSDPNFILHILKSLQVDLAETHTYLTKVSLFSMIVFFLGVTSLSLILRKNGVSVIVSLLLSILALRFIVKFVQPSFIFILPRILLGNLNSLLFYNGILFLILSLTALYFIYYKKILDNFSKFKS